MAQAQGAAARAAAAFKADGGEGGTWQRDGDVRNLIAGHVGDLTALLGGLATSSRDFH